MYTIDTIDLIEKSFDIILLSLTTCCKYVTLSLKERRKKSLYSVNPYIHTAALNVGIKCFLQHEITT